MTWEQTVQMLQLNAASYSYIMVIENTEKKKYKLIYIPINYKVSEKNVFEIESKNNCTKHEFLQDVASKLQYIFIKERPIKDKETIIDVAYKDYIYEFIFHMHCMTPFKQSDKYLYYDLSSIRASLIDTLYTNEELYSTILEVKDANDFGSSEQYRDNFFINFPQCYLKAASLL